MARFHDYHGRYLSTHGDELPHLPRDWRPTLLQDAVAVGGIIIAALLLMALLAYIAFLGAQAGGPVLVFVLLAGLWMMARGGGR